MQLSPNVERLLRGQLAEYHGRNPPLLIWEYPKPRELYAMGVDVADGAGHDINVGSNLSRQPDSSVVSIINCRTGMQVAEWSSRSTQPRDFAFKVAYLGRMYGGLVSEAFAVIEVNKSGISVIDTMRGPEIGYGNFFIRQSWDSLVRQHVPKLGWETNARTRPILIGRLRRHIRDTPEIVQSPRLADELSTWRYEETARHELVEQPSDGCHDDHLFAFGMALIGREFAPQALDVDLTLEELAAPPEARSSPAVVTSRIWDATDRHLDAHDARRHVEANLPGEEIEFGNVVLPAHWQDMIE